MVQELLKGSLVISKLFEELGQVPSAYAFDAHHHPILDARK